MNKQPLHRLTPEQLVAEIRRAAEDISDTAIYMRSAAMTLHAQTRRHTFREAAAQTAVIPEGAHREVAERIRREAVADITSVYTLYANSWQRFAGMVLQGSQRTTSTERIMRRHEEKREIPPEAPRREAPPVEAPEESEQGDGWVPRASFSMEDLVGLYGVETVQNARR